MGRVTLLYHSLAGNNRGPKGRRGRYKRALLDPVFSALSIHFQRLPTRLSESATIESYLNLKAESLRTMDKLKDFAGKATGGSSTSNTGGNQGQEDYLDKGNIGIFNNIPILGLLSDAVDNRSRQR